MASAAGSDGRRKAFEDLLHCMICFEAYRTPKMLQCGHTFCAECLTGYLRTYQQQKRAVPGKLPCPTCRDLTTLNHNGISGLRNDFKVKKIEEMFKTVSITKRSITSVCDPCKTARKSSAATMYCPNCVMNYCSLCSKKHAKNPVFKNHQAVDKSQERGSDLVCRVHSDEKGRYFCMTCQLIVCTICIVQGHDGHNVTEITELFKQHQQDIQNLGNVVETRLTNLKTKTQELEVIRQVNLTSVQQAEIAIRERAKQMMDFIRQEEKLLLEELRRKRDEKLKSISEEMERVSFHADKAFNLSDYAMNTLNKNSIQMMAVHEEFVQRMRTVAEADATMPDNKMSTVVRFVAGREDPAIGRIDEANADREEMVRAAAVQPRATPQHLRPQLSMEQLPPGQGSKAKLLININRYGGRPGEIRDPLGVACLLNGDLVVTEWGNKRVQLFDSVGNSVDVIGSRQLQAPQGVAVTLKGNVIVTDGQQKRLQVFSPSGTSLAKWGLGKFFTPCGICISPNGNCIVTDAGEHSVSIYQGEKTCIKRFGSQGNGDSKFNNPLYVATGQHNEIIVSDSDNHVVKLFDSQGNFRGKFGGQGTVDGCLHFPRGVCADQDGNIIVADRNNHRVTLFSRKGRFLRHLLTFVDGIRDPYAVAISITGNLVVTESAADRAAIKMFQL